MGGVAIRTELPAWVLAPTLAGFALVVGLLAGYDPKLAIAAALGFGFLLLALTDLGLGVALFALLTFLELAPAIGGPALSFSKAAGLVLALSWLALVTANPKGTPMFFSAQPAMTAAMAGLLCWAVLSLVWTEDQGQSISAISRWALNLALIPIVFTAISSERSAFRLVAALAAGATFAGLYGLAISPDASGAATSLTAATDLNRITSTVGDPNVLASLLVVGVITCLAVSLSPGKPALIRVPAGIGVVICLVSLLQTLSRGGMLALAAAMLAAVIFGGRWRPILAAAVCTVALMGVVYVAAVAPDDAVDRITQSDGGAGRTDIWKVGWRMVEANPALGVGVGNFNVSSIHYLLVEPGALARSEFIVDTPAVAHNVYLEVLAETGVIGLALFLTVIGFSLSAALRAARRFALSGEAGMELLARAALISTLGLLAADFFISAQFTKQLWLLLGLGPALLGIALRAADDAGTEPGAVSPARSLRATS